MTMELSGGAILLDIFDEDGVARVTLNRPERRNAMNRAMRAGLLEALKLVEPRDDIGCVMTVAAGGVAFCSGGDLYEIRDRRDHPEKYQEVEPDEDVDLFEAIRFFPKPTLAVVDGFCLGAGLHLMIVHDLAVASETAQLAMPEVFRGSYGPTVSPKLPIYTPLKKFFYLQLTGRYIDGIAADRWGMVTKAVPRDQLYDYSYALAKEIASHSHVALKYGKKVVYGVMEPHFEAGRKAAELGRALDEEVDALANLEGYLQSRKKNT